MIAQFRLGVLVLTFFLGGCSIGPATTTVEPWQKGILAKPHMAFDPDPLESKLHRHIQDSREGGSGGYGVGGGNCGCG